MPKIAGMTLPFVATMFVLLLASAAAFGQQRQFPLNEEILESRIVACIKQDDAVTISSAMSEWKMDMDVVDAITRHQIKARKCVLLFKVPITYSRMVYENPIGDRIRVYQGTIGSYQIFVPMQGFEHESI